MDDDDPYHPLLPSRASRRFARRSTASNRGYLIATPPRVPRALKITYESALERAVLLFLLAEPKIVDIHEQPPAIRYRTAEGHFKRHVLDFLITLSCGRRIAIVVKPAFKANSTKFQTELQELQGAVIASVAQSLMLVTERSFTRPMLREVEYAYFKKLVLDEETEETPR